MGQAEMNNRIAAIVVNYGTADLAIKAVESLLAGDHGAWQVEVHLVDNASPGEDAKMLQQAHAARHWDSRVTLWLETRNHGFGCGNNVVLQALSNQDDPPDRVFLLNPDAWIENQVIDLLATALERDAGAAAVGASVLRPDLSPVAAAFRFPGPASELARVVQFGPLDRLLRRHLLPLAPDHPAGPVDWVSGASVMFRFRAIAELGFFDPGYFLYYEEVDLMRRLQVAGWRVLFAPEARVVHEEGAATGQFSGSSGRKRDPAYLYQSWAHYFSGAYGRGGALAIALMLWPAAVLNVLQRMMRGKAPTIPLRFFRDHWRHVVRPLLIEGRR